MAVPKEPLEYVFKDMYNCTDDRDFWVLIGGGTPEMRMAKAKLAETSSKPYATGYAPLH